MALVWINASCLLFWLDVACFHGILTNLSSAGVSLTGNPKSEVMLFLALTLVEWLLRSFLADSACAAVGRVGPSCDGSPLVVPVKNRASRAVMVPISAAMNESINFNGRILRLMIREKSDMRVDGKTVEQQQQQKLANTLCTCDAPLRSSVG